MKYYTEVPFRQLEEYDIEFFVNFRNQMPVVTAAHIHTAVEILYITQGEFLIEAEGEQVCARPGDMVLFRSNTNHAIYNRTGKAGRYYVLKLTSRFLLQTFRGGNDIVCVLPVLKKQSGDRLIYPADALPPQITALWQRMIAEHTQKEATLYAMEKGYACQLMVLLYRHLFSLEHAEDGGTAINDKILSLIYQSVDYINENYASALEVGECAKMVNLSYSYYAKLFRTVTGKNFTAYLTDIRLAKAHSILLLTELSVTDVALSCGYKNLAHFIAAYRRRYGITPRQTRKERPGG